MADKDDAVVEESAEEVQDEQAAEPETMDDVIEKEAEAELDEERDESDEKEPDKESSDEESPADEQGDDGESDGDDADVAAEDEEPDETDEDESDEEIEEEPEPIDKSSFTEVGLEAVPDDYKPESWSSFMKDLVDVVRGEVNKEAQALDEQQSAFQSEVKKVDQGWQTEIGELQKSGDLPEGDKELEAATKEVFAYMAKNNKDHENNPNKQIWSFDTAFKLMKANSITDERKDEIATRRKSRAKATASSDSSDGGSGIPNVPKGASMDDIIAEELGLQ